MAECSAERTAAKEKKRVLSMAAWKVAMLVASRVASRVEKTDL